MIKLDDYGGDIRAAWEVARQQGGGEIGFGNRTYSVPANTVLPPAPNVSWRGEYGVSKLKVDGDGDLTIGDGVSEVRNFRADGVSIVAGTARNGWGLRARKIVRSVFRDFNIDPVESGWRTQFGMWLDGFDDVTLDNVGIFARTKSLLIHNGADLYLTGGGKIQTFRQVEPSSGEVGIHIAGNAGGVYLDAADIIYSDVDLLIDTAMTHTQNREIFLGTGLFFDSAGSDCVRVGPKAAGTLMATGTWFATAGLLSGGYPNGNGLNVHWDNGQLVGQLSGIKAFNCKGTGVALSGGRWIIGGGSALHNNGGYGLHRANAAAQVVRGSMLAFANGKGDYGGF